MLTWEEEEKLQFICIKCFLYAVEFICRFPFNSQKKHYGVTIVPILLIRGIGRCSAMSSHPVSSRPGLALSHLPLDEYNECDAQLLTSALCREGGLACGQTAGSQTILTIFPNCLPFYDPVVEIGSVGSHSHNIYAKRHIQSTEGMAQLVQCLPCKTEDLSLIPRSMQKCQAGRYAFASQC